MHSGSACCCCCCQLLLLPRRLACRLAHGPVLRLALAAAWHPGTNDMASGNKGVAPGNKGMASRSAAEWVLDQARGPRHHPSRGSVHVVAGRAGQGRAAELTGQRDDVTCFPPLGDEPCSTHKPCPQPHKAAPPAPPPAPKHGPRADAHSVCGQQPHLQYWACRHAEHCRSAKLVLPQA